MERKELYLVYFSEFTARFCTWAILSQLLMHLIGIHWQTSTQQLYMVGAAVSVLYMSTMFGGFLRDWLLLGKFVVLLGIGLISLGCFALMASDHFFYAGLGLTLLGAGMVTPNTPLLLSLENTHSDRAFTILYGVTNAGVILGSVLGGIMNEYFTWQSILLVNEAMVMIWFLFFIFSSWLSAIKNVGRVKFVQLVAVLIIIELVIYFYLKVKAVSVTLLIIAGISYLGLIIFLMVKNKSARKPLASSIFLIIFAIVFFSGELQVTSTLVDYSKHFVALNILHVTIPAGSLLALESIFVVLGAFIIARIKLLSNASHVQTKVLIGLFFGTLAFAVLYSSTFLASHHLISVLWIVLSFLLLGFGDVYLMPPIMAYVTESAPPAYKGRLMSGMYFSLSLSGYFSGLIGSSLSKHFTGANMNLHFYRTGFILMILLLGITAGLALIARIIGVFSDLKH